MHLRPGESFEDARRRWRVALAEYRDSKVIAICSIERNSMTRAFYGVEMQFTEQVI